MRGISFEGRQLSLECAVNPRLARGLAQTQRKLCVYLPAVGFGLFAILEVVVLAWSGHLQRLTGQVVVFGAMGLTIGALLLCLFATLYIRVEKLYHDLQDRMADSFRWFTEAHRDRSGEAAKHSRSKWIPAVAFSVFVLLEVVLLQLTGQLDQAESELVAFGAMGLLIAALLISLLLTVYIRVDKLYHDVVERFQAAEDAAEHWLEDHVPNFDQVQAACQRPSLRCT
eukprot:TRINITY_DN114091_c0_g1_i1.p1 TRINITY_DN114091_c0_g1~~TRINITY_DN114091_c0_g1_i1.p1  ORF type:complete len:227 (-),score=36.33 TRINITY_DN114091_c0_g1_i1:59-739(-)